jgi:hypothetical protein
MFVLELSHPPTSFWRPWLFVLFDLVFAGIHIVDYGNSF